ncbi:MoxR family ATPase [Thermosulfurimonas sp. F29]|uniref:AAA family ATPase n=1 Tax=Thermosulfurimonas sp. F29 TaxID=2867247 RepID=UPI001C83FB3E|nr:AAA family ATPase [Thermosulfurimonas sp. F29]MBX6423669.1 AAA family ATPase [Thermosulfurimonas sp. F29]
MPSPRDRLPSLLEVLNQVLRGKSEVVELAVSCFLAGGHLLLEDLPGTGKTTLAVALARTTGGAFRRVQFTNDLLPADLLGTEVWQASEGRFVFHPGPIFTNVLLADEINRASPRTQSALLEAMAEGRVSLSGKTYSLPEPFMVIATQNPLDLYGTYPLPESQLDRFLMRLSLGYPPREEERKVLAENGLYEKARELQPIFSREEWLILQKETRRVKVSDRLRDYLLDLAEASRRSSEFRYGFSTRGLLALQAAARALAYLRNRDFVTPDEVKAVFVPVAYHRLLPRAELEPGAREELLQEILSRVPVPL